MTSFFPWVRSSYISPKPDELSCSMRSSNKKRSVVLKNLIKEMNFIPGPCLWLRERRLLMGTKGRFGPHYSILRSSNISSLKWTNSVIRYRYITWKLAIALMYRRHSCNLSEGRPRRTGLSLLPPVNIYIQGIYKSYRRNKRPRESKYPLAYL